LGSLSLIHSSHFLILSSALSPWLKRCLASNNSRAIWLAKRKLSSSLTKIFLLGKGFQSGLPARQVAIIMPKSAFSLTMSFSNFSNHLLSHLSTFLIS